MTCRKTLFYFASNYIFIINNYTEKQLLINNKDVADKKISPFLLLINSFYPSLSAHPPSLTLPLSFSLLIPFSLSLSPFLLLSYTPSLLLSLSPICLSLSLFPLSISSLSLSFRLSDPINEKWLSEWLSWHCIFWRWLIS